MQTLLPTFRSVHSLLADRASFLWYSASESAQGAHLQSFIAIFAILIIAKQYIKFRK